MIGWPEVADSLVRHRASHLIVGVDAVLDPAVLSPGAQAALCWPSPQMLVERAVEQAVISGAEVTVLPADTPEPGPRRRSLRNPALLTHPASRHARETVSSRWRLPPGGRHAGHWFLPGRGPRSA